MIKITPEVEWRFIQKVVQSGPDDCWEWLASTSKNGYGQFNLGGMKTAHRVAFMIEHGYDAKGIVCHICDNRTCVNPKHLYDGTAKSNLRDRYSRYCGSELTKLQRAQIACLYAAGKFTMLEIANQFGVTAGTVANITTGQTQHIGEGNG